MKTRFQESLPTRPRRFTRPGHWWWILLVAACLPAAAARDALDRPNVVLVFFDDAGYADAAHTGNPTVRSPVMSRLVEEGLNFTQFYSASPACSASRYALFTGRNPRRSGLGTWVLDSNSTKYIHTNEVTLAEGLKARGYSTAIFGKWHLGMPTAGNANTTNSLPLAHGFDRWLGTTLSNDGDNSRLLNAPSTTNNLVPGYELVNINVKTNYAVQSTLTARYADESVAFIQAHKAEPFFLYLPFNMPHLPLNPGVAFAGTSPAGKLGDVIEENDHAIGRIISTLKAENIASNTLVVVTSDNGPWVLYYGTTNTSYYGDARLDVGYAGPFRDGKGSTWEGGVREFGFCWWPGVIAAGSVQRLPASTMDILPTVFALAGQSLPTGRTLDGRDLRPYLNPDLFPGTVPEFVYIYTGASANGVYGARKGPWKLHTAIYSQTGNNYGYSGVTFSSPLLFHVEYDVGERLNQRASQPTVVSDLQATITGFNNQLAVEQTFWGAP